MIIQHQVVSPKNINTQNAKQTEQVASAYISICAHPSICNNNKEKETMHLRGTGSNMAGVEERRGKEVMQLSFIF